MPCPRVAGATPWDSLDARLVAVVFDTSYVAYAEAVFQAGGAYLPHASTGITGAMGFFASAATARVPFRIVRPPDR